MEFIVTCFVTITIYLTSCNAINITDCGSKGVLHNLTFTGCLNISEEVCRVERGTNGTLEVSFSPVKKVYDLTMKAFGIFKGIQLALTLPNPDLCFDSMSCPVSAYSNQTYSTKLTIPTHLPKLKADVKWQIQDEAMNDVVCVQFPVQVV